MNRADIPEELVRAINGGNAVLFIGENLSQDAGFPSFSDAMFFLVRSSGIQHASPQDAATAYETLMGRHGLTRHMLETYRKPIEPTASHSLLTVLPIKLWITTNIDDLLERTLERDQIPHKKIVSSEDLAFVEMQDRVVLKMFGDFSRPNSLVLTTKDHLDYHATHEALETWIKAQLINKTIVFVGYSLDNPIFAQIRSHISRLVQGLDRMSFAILPEVSDLQKTIWRESNICCITPASSQFSSSTENRVESMLRELVRLCTPTPVYTSPLERLVNEVRQWLQVLGYTITLEKQGRSVEHDMRAEIRVGLMFQKVLIRCIDGQVSVPQLMALEAITENQEVSQVWVISERQVPLSAVRYAENKSDKLEVFSYDGFVRSIIDFEPYFRWLEQKYRESNISEYYVPLSCEKPAFDESSQLIAADAYDDIDAYVDDWLITSGRNHISILGNFGSGKTWFCLHYAYRLLQKYRKSPHHHRIPLLISLRDYARTADVRQLVTDLLINRYHVQMTGGFSVFQRLNDSGRLLLIFDGFDEMARKMDEQTVVDNFWRLAEVVRPESKIVLTCRTAYFRYRKEAEEILSGKRDSRTVIDLSKKPEFEIVNLLPFDEQQIQSALARRLGLEQAGAAFEQMRRIHDLADLAKRPVMLEMIASSIDQIVECFTASERLGVSDLYRLYVDRWINKNVVEERTFLDPESKRFFMQELAWQMYRDDISSVHYSELSDRILEYFTIMRPKELDHFDYDLRTQAFLVRDHDGRYAFAHRSFMEYFVACYLVRILEMRFSTDSDNKVGSLPGDIRDMPIPEIVQTFGFRRISPEIRQFMVGLRPNQETLWEGIEFTRGKRFEDVGYVGSNAVSLLAKMGADFSDKDLSRTVLRDADLSGANLSRANCSGVDGKGLNLQMANLTNTNFSYSELHHVILGDSDVIREVMFVSDSEIICCGSEPLLRVIEAESGRVLRELPARTCIRSLDISPDGHIVIGGGLDATMRVWNLESSDPSLEIRVHEYPIYGVAYDPVRQQVATGSSDHTVAIWSIKDDLCTSQTEKRSGLWEIERREPIAVLRGHPHHVRSVAYEPNGRWLVSAGVRGLVRVWDPNTWQNIRTLTAEGDPGAFQARFSPDGQYLAVGLADSSVKIWHTGTWELVATLKNHPGFVLSLAFHPHSNKLAAASRDGSVTVWDNMSSPVKHCVLKVHNDAILSLRYHPDGKRVIIGGGGNIVKLLDLETQKIVWEQKFGGENLRYQGMNITGVKGVVSHFLQFLREQGALDENHEIGR